jgi:hypothetical protein
MILFRIPSDSSNFNPQFWHVNLASSRVTGRAVLHFGQSITEPVFDSSTTRPEMSHDAQSLLCLLIFWNTN